jgi:uridine kinase
MNAVGFDNERSVDAIISEIRRCLTGRTRPLLVAIDGRSGVGKSTLAAVIAVRTDATVIEGDDFYAGGSDAEWAARSAGEKVAGCIDWRRLRTEALEPLLADRVATWRPFDFAAGTGLAGQPVIRAPATVVILDGIYSARPELADLVDLAVLVEAEDDRVRRQRLIEREGSAFMDAWHALWDDAEDLYFTRIRPADTFDLIISS